MKLLCVGDVALADSQYLQHAWKPPADLQPGAEQKIILNWELPIGNRCNPQPRVSGPRLLADPQAVKILREWSPGIATLATNHILDAGSHGLEDTIEELNRLGFQTVGAGTATQAIAAPLLLNTQEGKVAITNWVFPETHPDWMIVPGPNCWPGLEPAKDLIQQLRKSVDWIIALLHWSDELFPYPRPQDRQIARGLATAGVDVIIGHHPHVVRGMETIGACQVFYSLGNYHFSDIPDGRGGWMARQAPRNREALGVLLDLRAGVKIGIELLPYWQMKHKTGKDTLRRATRRLLSVSKPLTYMNDVQYAEWYMYRRAYFDKVDYRLNFGLWYLGKRGLIRYARRLLPSRLLRTMSDPD